MTTATDRLVRRARTQRAALLTGLRKNPTGEAWCRKHTAFADRIVRAICRMTSPHGAPPTFALVATGGYGRRELAPRSDIDITFIPLDEQDTETEQAVRETFRLLIAVFAALEWPVGYAYRLVSDCPALDAITRTGLMDARFICGSREAFEGFNAAFEETFPVADFLISKIEEREEMRSRWHDTPRVAEFHIRDGAGGLRDLQTARWFGHALGFRPVNPLRWERELLLKVRNALHLATDRKQDQLVRTRLPAVAKCIGLCADKLAADVMRAGEAVEAEWMNAVRRARRAAFVLAPGVVAAGEECHVAPAANLADAAVGVCRAVRLGLRLRPSPVSDDLGDAPRVIECITSGEAALRGLDSVGLLDRLLPEFAACRFLMSRDSMHRYSVAEHSMQVVKALDGMRGRREYEAAWSEVTNPRPLYLAALLHDVGKADVSASHAKTGSAISERVCVRLGMAGDEKDSTVFLVREHLTFPQVARTHDLAQPETAFNLAKLCARPDRLAMLYLLAAADTSSVNEEAWTPQMAASAAELYEKTRRALGLESPPEDPALYWSGAVRRLKTAGVETEAVEEFLETMPTRYLLSTPLKLFPLHADYVRRARRGESTVVFHHRPESHTTDITICRRDLARPGLLSRILGIIYALDLTTHAARAASTKGSKPVALDTLSVSFQGRPLPQGLCRQVSAELKDRLGSGKSVDALLRKHGKDPRRRQEMLTHRFYEGDFGVLEVETPLGRGMPYRVAKMLAGLGWNVQVARIGQWAGRAVARFYLDLPGGERLTKKLVVRALGPCAE
ncbi:MAG: HD domain-containing protein [Armatimonadetes bacterium]|nr:HD domain-containing protein [Armatimonadota bacterium]